MKKRTGIVPSVFGAVLAATILLIPRALEVFFFPFLCFGPVEFPGFLERHMRQILASNLVCLERYLALVVDYELAAFGFHMQQVLVLVIVAKHVFTAVFVVDAMNFLAECMAI